MSAARTEATCRIGIAHEDESGARALTYDEVCAFVSEVMEHLLVEDRVIDPVVSGDAETGEIEITFELPRPVATSETDVEVFDIVHDAGAALGAQWRNLPDSDTSSGSATPTRSTTMLTRHSQQIQEVHEPLPA
ncbi:hypothetical protein [Candidatus Poriferisodalis sp.]|uniref:hypothetical protein n=1 Tax=Candidatus Poriferisodalis sp. TaxID=3101277 RepID=UPI003B019499